MNKEKHIIIIKGTELYRLPVHALMFIEADGNYCYLQTCDGHRQLLPMQLGQIEDLLNDQLGEDSGIVRLGRGLIINTYYIHVIDITRQKLVLSDFAGSYHDLSASRNVLLQLKTLMENEK